MVSPITSYWLQRQEKEENATTAQEMSKEEREIERYQEYKPNHEEMKTDPIDYWVNNFNTYQLLSPIGCDILATPASSASAPVERTFSISGEATSGRRNRLTDYNLERETLLRRNKKYIY